MKNLIAIILMATATLLLTGCFEKNQELKKGIDLVNRGGESDLIEAREFFNEYLSDNPDDKGALKWVAEIDKKYIEVGKNAAEKEFEAQNFEEAYRIMENLLAINPNDKEIKTGYELVEKSYLVQKEFDEFAVYLESVYDKQFKIYSDWDKSVSEAVLGTKTVDELILDVKTHLLETSELRKTVQDKTFSLKNDYFIEINKYLFEYVNGIENSLSTVATIKNDGRLSGLDIKDRVNGLKSEYFNRIFLNVQKDISYYINEKNNNGEKVRNVKNTLNFSATLESVEEDEG